MEEGTAYANLGIAYQSQGDLNKAIEYHTQHLAIAMEVGDRAGEGTAYANLGYCHVYFKAVACFEAQHALAILLKLARMQCDAALNMGIALTLHVRAGRQAPTTGADQAPGPHSHSSASAVLQRALSGYLRTGRHKDICGVLSKWREVVKDGVAPDSCTADLVAFLQR